MDGFIGEVKLFAGQYTPKNWLPCDGGLLSISQYTTLFAILGTTWGGDGRTTFAVPDFRGRVPIGPGQGPGLTPRYIGYAGGAESASIPPPALPVHAHGVSGMSGTICCNNAESTKTDPTGHNIGRAAGESYNDSDPTTTMSPGNVTLNGHLESTGGNSTHENMQPWLCMRYIICCEGVFPPRQ